MIYVSVYVFVFLKTSNTFYHMHPRSQSRYTTLHLLKMKRVDAPDAKLPIVIFQVFTLHSELAFKIEFQWFTQFSYLAVKGYDFEILYVLLLVLDFSTGERQRFTPFMHVNHSGGSKIRHDHSTRYATLPTSVCWIHVFG